MRVICVVMKIIRFFLLALFMFTVPLAYSQNDEMVRRNRKERKKVWRRWNKKRDAYNPYLKKKNKDKPSVKEARSSKREIRRQRRDFKKQTRRGKRNTR